MLYPLIWLVGASFKSNAEIFARPRLLAAQPDVRRLHQGLADLDRLHLRDLLLQHLPDRAPEGDRHGDLLTAVAYGFARFDFPGKKILFALLIGTLLLPNVVTRIPQYLLFRDIGWLDTFLPLWVPSAFAGDAFFVFMLVQFLRAIPRDMEEAARVDGANAWQRCSSSSCRC